MSSENNVINEGEHHQITKKRKLEDVEEGSEKTYEALHIDTDELVIEAEADKFLTIFERIFIKETSETDVEDGPAREILHKVTSAIKDKIDTAFTKKRADKIRKLIFSIVEIIINSED